MAVLMVDVGERPRTLRADLAVLTDERGVAAVSDVLPGAHHVSVLLASGWHHGWAFVEAPDDVIGLGPAVQAAPDVDVDAAVAMPADSGDWAALTAHLDTPEAVFDDVVVQRP